jgi:hypothetical protein
VVFGKYIQTVHLYWIKEMKREMKYTGIQELKVCTEWL